MRRLRVPNQDPRAGAECRQRQADRQRSSSLRLKSRMESIVEEGRKEEEEGGKKQQQWLLRVGYHGGRDF